MFLTQLRCSDDVLVKLNDAAISNPVHFELLTQEIRKFIYDPLATEGRFVITNQILQNNENMENWLTTELEFKELILPQKERVLTISTHQVNICNLIFT